MKRKPCRILILSLASSLVLSVPALAANIGSGRVNATALYLRAGQSTDTAILATVPGGTVVAVEEQQGDWYKVNYKGTLGYMSAQYINFTEAASADLGPGRLTGTSVRVRQSASYEAEVLGHLNTGDTVTVTGVVGEWYAVETDGKSGFVHSDFIALGVATAGTETTVDIGQTIVETAKQYLGSPYVWGGNSPGGFDCSGFVKYVYNECGYTTKRTAADIATEGTAIEREDLLPGDVVYFTNGGSSYIGHVGIYIGENEFIHASTSKTGVIISELDYGSYTTRYAGGRRIAY